jgi:hypothetical protein
MNYKIWLFLYQLHAIGIRAKILEKLWIKKKFSLPSCSPCSLQESYLFFSSHRTFSSSRCTTSSFQSYNIICMASPFPYLLCLLFQSYNAIFYSYSVVLVLSVGYIYNCSFLYFMAHQIIYSRRSSCVGEPPNSKK